MGTQSTWGQSFHDSLTNMKMFVVLALAAMAMAEPEADPQLLYTAGVHTPVTSINNVPVVNAVPHVYNTAVHSVHAPVVSTVASSVYAHPTVYYGKRDAEAEPEADALYGYYGYRNYGYSAYRPYAYRPYAYGAWGYGKRSADAEAEADPALLYTTSAVHTPVHSVVSSPLVSALTPAATLKTVHTPVTYSVPAVPPVANTVPAVTYAGVHAVHTPVVNTVGSTVYYGKREAEADPALLYSHAVPAVHSVVSSPLVHHTYAVPTVAKTVVPAVTVAKTVDHGVVGTYAGLVHSSHAGICLNNVGVQVPC